MGRKYCFPQRGQRHFAMLNCIIASMPSPAGTGKKIVNIVACPTNAIEHISPSTISGKQAALVKR
jgi:hypothetical protein